MGSPGRRGGWFDAISNAPGGHLLQCSILRKAGRRTAAMRVTAAAPGAPLLGLRLLDADLDRHLAGAAEDEGHGQGLAGDERRLEARQHDVRAARAEVGLAAGGNVD